MESLLEDLESKMKRAVVKQEKLQALLPDKKQTEELKREVKIFFVVTVEVFLK